MRLEGTDVPGPRADAGGRAVAGRLLATGHLIAARRHLRARAHAPGRSRPSAAGAVTWLKRRHGCEGGAYAIRDGLLAIRRGSFRDRESAGLGGLAYPRHAGGARCRSASCSARSSTMRPSSALPKRASCSNNIYDSFVAGTVRCRRAKTSRLLPAIPTSRCFSPLKTTIPRRRSATKTPIFERRTLERYRPVEHVETAAEALAVSLNETGEIHWPRMEQLTGRTAGQLRRELGSLVYCNPEGGGWETADRYLSGNVRAKLATATAAAEIDSVLQAQYRSLKGRATRRPGAGRHRGASRVVVDSGHATSGNSWRSYSTSLRPMCAWPTPPPSPPGQSRVDDGARYNVRNTTTPGARRGSAPPS